MTRGVTEIDPPAAEVSVYPARLPPRRVGPVVETTRLDPAEDCVELGLRDEEGVVLRLDRRRAFDIVKADAIGGPHHQKRSELLRLGEAEKLDHEPRRSSRIS